MNSNITLLVVFLGAGTSFSLSRWISDHGTSLSQLPASFSETKLRTGQSSKLLGVPIRWARSTSSTNPWQLMMQRKKATSKSQPDAEVRWPIGVVPTLWILTLRLSLGKFLGQRFIKGKDVGLVLIYDVQGTIAGVQMAVSGWLFSLKSWLTLYPIDPDVLDKRKILPMGCTTDVQSRHHQWHRRLCPHGLFHRSKNYLPSGPKCWKSENSRYCPGRTRRVRIRSVYESCEWMSFHGLTIVKLRLNTYRTLMQYVTVYSGIRDTVYSTYTRLYFCNIRSVIHRRFIMVRPLKRHPLTRPYTEPFPSTWVAVDSGYKTALIPFAIHLSHHCSNLTLSAPNGWRVPVSRPWVRHQRSKRCIRHQTDHAHYCI